MHDDAGMHELTHTNQQPRSTVADAAHIIVKIAPETLRAGLLLPAIQA